MTQSPQNEIQIPAELIIAHQFYNRLFFNETFQFTNELEGFFTNNPKQLRLPQNTSRLAVNKRILNLAYTDLFEHLGQSQAEKLILEFCFCPDASKSLIIHKKIADFYHFAQKQLFIHENPILNNALEIGYIHYELLYAEDVQNAFPGRSAPNESAILLECGVEWLTPWAIYAQHLYFRNRDSLLIENVAIDFPQIWLHLQNNPLATLQECLENQLDDVNADAMNAVLVDLQKTLQLLHSKRVLKIVQGNSYE